MMPITIAGRRRGAAPERPTVTTTPLTAEALARRLLHTEDAEQRRALIDAHRLDSASLHDTVTRMDAEAERLLGVDPRRMERLCLDMLALAERAGDKYLEAVARRRLGDALRAQGRFAAVLQQSEAAAAIFTRLGYEVDAARARLAWCVATASLGDVDDAVRVARKLRRVFVAHGETLRIAMMDLNIGLIL